MADEKFTIIDVVTAHSPEHGFPFDGWMEWMLICGNANGKLLSTPLSGLAPSLLVYLNIRTGIS